MVIIYIKNKPLFLIDKIEKATQEYFNRPDTIFIDDLSPTAMLMMIHRLEQEEYYAGIFLHYNLDELLAAFKMQFTLIVAAGGLVHTAASELLLILRKGKWDLPKGKLDEAEDIETCALREIEEETGAKNLQIEQLLLVTYHTYREKEIHILKESHWFLVKANERSLLTPQTQEDILKCQWVPMHDVANYTNNMHASIIDVMTAGKRKLQEKNF